MERLAERSAGQGEKPPALGRAPRMPAVATGSWDDPAIGAALSALSMEIEDQIAWEQRRHDLEMRQNALMSELSRVLGRLSVLLARYDELQLERAAADPPIPHQTSVPCGLRRLVETAWQRVTTGHCSQEPHSC